MGTDLNAVAGKVFTSPLTGQSYGVIRRLQGAVAPDFPSGAGWKPVAEDDCGNCFGVSPAGAVCFWDHETGEIEIIAESLESFRENSSVPEEAELKPGQVKSAWIDPELARRLGMSKDGRKQG